MAIDTYVENERSPLNADKRVAVSSRGVVASPWAYRPKLPPQEFASRADGNSDILWQNARTGEVSVEEMNRTSLTGRGSVAANPGTRGT